MKSPRDIYLFTSFLFLPNKILRNICNYLADCIFVEEGVAKTQNFQNDALFSDLIQQYVKQIYLI